MSCKKGLAVLASHVLCTHNAQQPRKLCSAKSQVCFAVCMLCFVLGLSKNCFVLCKCKAKHAYGKYSLKSVRSKATSVFLAALLQIKNSFLLIVLFQIVFSSKQGKLVLKQH
jgi:hypothetical protein